MIYSNIKNKDDYKELSWLATALDNAEKYSDPSLAIGAYPIDERVRAVVNHYTTSEFEEGKFENHRDHIDVQYIVSGRERIAVVPTEECRLVKEYDAASDYEMYAADKSVHVLEMKAGDFAVLYPGEAHYPGLTSDGTPSEVHKIVFKVKAK